MTPVSAKTRTALLLTFLFVACSSAEEIEQEAVRARDIRPVILGQPGPGGVPQWRAVLEPGLMLLDSPTSAGWYRVALGEYYQASPSRLVYAADRVRLVMDTDACDIPRYLGRLRNRATLDWDGGRFVGCNGPGALPEEMAGTAWELVRIGDAPAPQGRSPAAVVILGRDGALGGTLACNDGGIRTRWTQAGGFVTGTPGFEQTAMGCNDPAVEAFGTRFWNGLQTARSWRRDHGRVTITFADGTEAELRFLI